LASFYEPLARILNTKPIHVRIARDAFTFRCGDTEFHLRPLVWWSSADPKGKVLAVDGEPVPPAAVPLDLCAPDTLAVSMEVRQRALQAVLAYGFKRMSPEATFQRPVVVFEADVALAHPFEGQQREALRRAASAVGAFGSEFR
jgi:hypothetical protein